MPEAAASVGGEGPRVMTASAAAYMVSLRCVDCGNVDGEYRPTRALEEIADAKTGRPLVMLLVNVPARCEKCHNLRAVTA